MASGKPLPLEGENRKSHWGGDWPPPVVVDKPMKAVIHAAIRVQRIAKVV